MRTKNIFIGDFETTVYKGQKDTQVWASALVPIGSDDVMIHHSIGETYEYLEDMKKNVIVYYHNLKFDGSFWLSYLLVDRGFEQAYEHEENTLDYAWLKNKDMPSESVKYSISDMGAWYTITIKTRYGRCIEIRDSLKLLPFSVKRIGKSFGTQHQKLEMEYKGFRYPGCLITAEEREYIANDVLVVKEALEIMFDAGHQKLTIGSCCMQEFKNIYGEDEYKRNLSPLDNLLIESDHGADTADAYIRKSYRGGWCYLASGKENKVYHKGVTADVNSLYPSMMSSESGNRFPVGKPHFWKGEIPAEAIADNKYYFVRFKCRFKLKPGYLPFIQIKGNALYEPNECLETSSLFDKESNTYYRYYEYKGETRDTIVELTMTCTDWILFNEHYDLYDLDVMDGCWFWSESGFFDKYMEKYKKIKMESKGAMRELAKLFLNNLYGKMASNPKSNFKVAYVKEDKSLGFINVEDTGKEAGYIPIGSAITSYARNFTIRTAQKNYHGKDKPGFIYADTDSIHCDLEPDELIDVPVHPTAFCHWKLESTWDVGIFVRQKTYIEHIVAEDLQPIDKPFYNIKCAGMPDKCKELLRRSIEQDLPEDTSGYTTEEIGFMQQKRSLKDFRRGLIVPGKLLPKRIPGGVLLTETTYEMR